MSLVHPVHQRTGVLVACGWVFIGAAAAAACQSAWRSMFRTKQQPRRRQPKARPTVAPLVNGADVAEQPGLGRMPTSPALPTQYRTDRKVYRVVVTGGPCAGKSTGMTFVRKHLEKQGFNVFVVPEAATLLIDGGAGVALSDFAEQDRVFAFQHELLLMQIRMEDALCEIAKCLDKPAVVLCDRGSMDGRAFCSPELWDRILQAGNWSTTALRDSRYDLVLHLVTAANGAEDFYTTANNLARSESPEEARQQDAKLLKSWLGHPRHKIIDNKATFEEKLERALAWILQLVGVGAPANILRFHLKYQPPNQFPVPTTSSLVTVTTLRGSSSECICRLTHKREMEGGGVSCSYLTLHRGTGRKNSTTIQRTEEHLSINTYTRMLQHKDPDYEVVQKVVTCFLYDNLKYELEQVIHPPHLSSSCVLFVEEEKKPATEPRVTRRSSTDDILKLVPGFLRKPGGQIAIVSSTAPSGSATQCKHRVRDDDELAVSIYKGSTSPLSDQASNDLNEDILSLTHKAAVDFSAARPAFSHSPIMSAGSFPTDMPSGDSDDLRLQSTLSSAFAALHRATEHPDPFRRSSNHSDFGR